MRNFPINMPSISVQDGAAKNLDALAEEAKRFESIYRQKLNALDELKKSLLHRAFSGDL